MDTNDEDVKATWFLDPHSHGHMFMKSMHIDLSFGSHDAPVSMVMQVVFQSVTS